MPREPPAERAEPKDRAMKKREAFGERVAADDVRDFMSQYGVEFGGFPFAPAGGEQNGGATHAEGDWHGEQIGFGQARRGAQACCATEKIQARHAVRVCNTLRFPFEAAPQDYAEREAHQHEDRHSEIQRDRGGEPWKWATGLRGCR